MANYQTNRDLILVDKDGNTNIIYPTTNALGVIISTTENTNKADGSSAIPKDVTNLQELINKLGTGAFSAGGSGGSNESFRDIITTSTEITEEGFVPDATVIALFADRLDELEKNVSSLMYTPISISSFTNNISVSEMGSVVTSLTLKYTLNKIPSTATLNGNAIAITAKSGSIEITDQSISSAKTWTLNVIDDKGSTSSKSTSLNFYNGVYYGASEDVTNYDSEFILGFTKVLSNTHSRTITVNSGENQYIWYIIPSRLGTPNFNVGGFEGGFENIKNIEFVNKSGYQEEYSIWRSDNMNLGSTKIIIS